MSGTSEIVAIASAERIGAPGVVTFPPAAGLTINAGPTQSGGDALQWWAEAIGRDIAGVLALAAKADRDGRPILFLPHLEGERAPLWDAELRGAFVGLDRRTGAPELALAVMEGVALSARIAVCGLRRRRGRRDGAAVPRRRRRALRSLGADPRRLSGRSARPRRLPRRRLSRRRDDGGGRRRRLSPRSRRRSRACPGSSACSSPIRAARRATTRCSKPTSALPRRCDRSAVRRRARPSRAAWAGRPSDQIGRRQEGLVTSEETAMKGAAPPLRKTSRGSARSPSGDRGSW